MSVKLVGGPMDGKIIHNVASRFIEMVDDEFHVVRYEVRGETAKFIGFVVVTHS